MYDNLLALIIHSSADKVGIKLVFLWLNDVHELSPLAMFHSIWIINVKYVHYKMQFFYTLTYICDDSIFKY